MILLYTNQNISLGVTIYRFKLTYFTTIPHILNMSELSNSVLKITTLGFLTGISSGMCVSHLYIFHKNGSGNSTHLVYAIVLGSSAYILGKYGLDCAYSVGRNRRYI